MKKLLSCLLMVCVLGSPAASLAGDGPHAHPKKKHTGLGLAVGLTSGLILGAWASAEIVGDYGDFGTFMLTWSAFAATGAVAGYAAGGGFSKDEYETSMDRNRQTLRQEAVADLDLSLSPIPELDLSQGLLLAEIYCFNTTAGGC